MMYFKLKQSIRFIIILSLCFLIVGLLLTSSLAAELTDIEKRGQLIVGIKDNLRPLGFRDENGNLQGLEIDIAHQLAQEILGDSYNIILKPVTNQERLDLLLNDQVDLLIAQMSVTKPRSRLVAFSDYYYLDGTGIITKDNTIKSVKQLQNSQIAVIRDSSTISVIKSILPQAQLVGVNSYQEALQILETNQAQGFASDITILTGFIQEYSQYNLLPERLSSSPLSIAMGKGLQYLKLRQKVNNTISMLKESGWLDTRIKYWGL